MSSTLRVQIPWQRSGPGVGTTRRHSRVNADIFLQQQMEESVEDEEDDQQIRLEVPRLGSSRTGGHRRRQEEAEHQRQRERAAGGEGEGGVGPREGDLDVMSATSTALGHVHPSSSSLSQRERRAQIDAYWCNVPDMFVDPASRAAYYWMALVTVAVVYNWIVIILRVAFEDMRDSEPHQRAFRVLDTISDVIYLMDVAIQSRTAYLEDGCLVKSLPETVRHYRYQPYFALDVLSVVPVTTVLDNLSKIGLPRIFESGFNSLSTPALRILRLLKYPSMTRFFEKTDSRTNNPNLLRAFRLSLHLWLVIHWIGCFYYLLSQYEGLGSNDWVYPNSTEYAAFRRKYIFCMYWSTMTLTTIGERPWPVTDVEYIFTGVTFLIGVFVFAAVVGNVGDVISNMNAARHDFQARMDQIKFFLNHRNVPEHLQDQIKRWAEYTWARTKAINEHSVLQLLPNRLRTEVAIHVHLKTLKKVRIFEQCEEGLLRELVLKLRPSIYSPGEYICRIGEIGREMYIIDHGKVEILFPEHGSGQMKQVAIMMPGNYFGEISLLKLDEGQNKRTADVRSVGFSELLCLSRRDLMAAIMEYPEAKKILEAQARQRMQQTKRPPHESDPESSPVFSSYPETSGALLGGARFASGRRSARAVFAQVMRQEGFSRLLASTANEELAEMKNILQELKEIKKQIYETKAKQQAQQGREADEQKHGYEELQQIRTQLLQQTGALVTSSSGSSLTNPADLSSDASTVTSPTVAQCLPHTPPVYCRQSAPGRKSSATRNVPSPLKQSTLHNPSDHEVILSGGMSDEPEHPAKVVKALSPFGCSVSPRPIANSQTLSPARTFSPDATLMNIRRRRSPSARVPISKDKDQLENVDRLAEGAQGANTLLAVAQGGGGDEPAMAAVEKDDPIKDLDEERKGMVSANKSISNTFSCKESLSSTASVESAIGSYSSLEFRTPSSVASLEIQPGFKPATLRVRSEQFRPLAQSDSFKSLASRSNSSSYSSTSYYSSTTSSSGGRGRSPKPAKPRPRYPKQATPENFSYDSINKEEHTENLEESVHTESQPCGNVMTLSLEESVHTESQPCGNVMALSLEESVPTESQPCGNVMALSTDTEDTTVESNVSSEGFSAVSLCSSMESGDSVKSSHMKSFSSSSSTCLPIAEQNCVSTECTVHKHDQCPSPVNKENEKSDGQTKTVKADTDQGTGLSQQERGYSSSECAEFSACTKTQEESVLPQVNLCAEDQIFIREEKDHAEHIDVRQHSSADETGNETTEVAVVDALEKDIFQPVADDESGEPSEDSSNSDAESKGSFIAATRVKSDFDKRVSSKELEDMPRTITYKKIDDSQLSILLAKRREVNDSSDYTVEGPGNPNIFPVNVGSPDLPRSEHSHSVHSVIDSTPTAQEDHAAPSVQENLILCDGKPASDGAADPTDLCPSGEEHKPPTAPDDSVMASENKSDCIKAEPSKRSSVSTDEHQQNDSFQDLVYNEDLVLEHTGCIKSDESAGHASQDLYSKNDDGLITSNEQSFQKTEGKTQVDTAGLDHCAAAAELQMKSEMKEKKYPVSILKKHQPETLANECDGSDSHMAQHSDIISPENAVPSTHSCVDSSIDQPVLLDIENCPEIDTLAEHGLTSLSKNERNEHTGCNVNQFNRELSPVDLGASVCLRHCEKHTDNFQERNHNEPVSPQYDLSPLQFKKAEPQTSIEENKNGTSPSHHHQYSAVQDNVQNPEKRGRSVETPRTCTDPPDVMSSIKKDEVSSVTTSNLSGAVSSGQATPTRRHSEKLDSLIATFDHSMKRYERDDCRNGGQTNDTLGLAQSNTVSQPETEIEPAENNKAECSQNDRLDDSVVDNTSVMRASNPVKLSREVVEEAKSADSSSLTSGLANIPPQRKTLRRRGLTKHVFNPYDRKEGPCKDKLGAHDCDDGSDLTFPASSVDVKKDETMDSQKPPTEDITTCISLVKNLVWEVGSNKKPLSKVRDEDSLSTTKEKPDSQEKANSQSSFVEQASSTSALSNNYPLHSDSHVRPNEMQCSRDVCVDENVSPSSFQEAESLPGSDPITSVRNETASVTKNTSFKDKIKEAADRSECAATLNKDNNSAVACSLYTSSSGGSSPSECMITRSVCASSFHMKPADLICPNQPIIQHICFQASDDVNQNTFSSSDHLFSTGGHVPTPCQENNPEEEVESTQQTGAIKGSMASALPQIDDSTRLHSTIELDEEETLERGSEPNSDALARPETGFPRDTAAGGRSDTEWNDSVGSQLHTTECYIQVTNLQQAGSSHRARPVEGAANSQGQRKRQSKCRVGGSTAQALHWHPSLLDSPGATSMDESPGEGERDGEAEVAGSFILLSDFGVDDDDDDEGALSGLSGCEDHSDINSDLDEL